MATPSTVRRPTKMKQIPMRPQPKQLTHYKPKEIGCRKPFKQLPKKEIPKQIETKETE